MNKPHILMCPPVHYGIEYEINPWMSTERQADHGLANHQWQALRQILLDAGAMISDVQPVAGLPDLVFTANSAIVFGKRAVLARFKHEQRQGEEPHFRRWLEAHSWQVDEPPADFSFEGAGDALFCGDTLYAGYRQRSDASGHQQIGEMLGVRVLPLELVDPYYYHLDTCFCPLAPDEAIYLPAAFDDYGQRVLAESIPKLHSVEEDEAKSFACNAVVVGKTVVTNIGCPELHAMLRSIGFDPIETPLSEFVKAGGSAKCLTLRLDGEEAAGWKG
ncbi:dimethylarginine dimethylaminohydrolase family protein [Bythopirellula goksoeyrii]|uniref:N(G),N(G)-dimethylarginine dimethylaminohydrolase n=1 Tax=Bythopirellula goksoeyrii TaxID=1400387 RepID=A0A5B9Q8M9_9BACT|nr:arginine deiminase-related protein [Bythopirellula goksoeyrii]QEG35347.1 N(G),N(G)-dimethylarginine dimethylaminohydrolase [Bythopirellula goksoeyrii]